MSNGNGKPTSPPPSPHFVARKRSGHGYGAFLFEKASASQHGAKRPTARERVREKAFWGYGREGQVAYDPQENLIAVISRWRGTMLPLVLRGSGGLTFWGLIFVHFLMLLYNELMPVPTLDFSVVVGLPASLLIFLVVFYAGNCWTRFFTLWDCTVDLSVLVHEWTSILGSTTAEDAVEMTMSEFKDLVKDVGLETKDLKFNITDTTIHITAALHV